MTTLDEKLEHTLSIIRDYITEEGFVLAFSGGKDTSALKHIMVTYFPEVPLKCMCIRTGLDSDFLMDFLNEYHPDTEFVEPEEDLFELMRRTGYLPTIKNPYCCNKIHAQGWHAIQYTKRYTLFGIRHDDYWHESESDWGAINEPGHGVVHPDGYHKTMAPIFEWSEADVDEYIARHNIPLPPEYGMGERLFTCPLCCSIKVASKRASARMYPKLTARYKALCEEFWNKDPELQKMYESPDAYWEMYLSSRSTGAQDQQ